MARWIKVPANLWRNPRYRGVSNAQLGALVRLSTWSMDNGTDGLIPLKDVAVAGVDWRTRGKLESAGLLVLTQVEDLESSPNAAPKGAPFAVANAVRIVGWEQLQTSEKELKRARLARLEAGRRMANARWNKH